MGQSFTEVLQIIFQIALVIAPHIGYAVQFVGITRSCSFDGYAPLVSLILLCSNTLRIYYYIGYHYLLALLIQACVGVPVHIALLWKVLEVHYRNLLREQPEDAYDGNYIAIFSAASQVPSAVVEQSSEAADSVRAKRVPTVEGQSEIESPSHAEEPTAQQTVFLNGAQRGVDAPLNMSLPHLRTFNSVALGNPIMRFFFRVEDCLESALLRHTPLHFFLKYLLIATVSLVLVFGYYRSIGLIWKDAAEVVGYLALGVEALLVVPQILRNARRGSTKGLTVLLVLTWVVGDAIKVGYFIYIKQSFPFIVCGCLQILLDIIVVAQFICYRFILRRDSDVCVGVENDLDR